MNLIRLHDIHTPGTEMFWKLTDPQLRHRQQPGQGIIIVESPKVIRVALRAGLQPLALLCEERHVEGDASDIVGQCDGLPVYVGPREVLAAMTGYTLTRGVLCAMRRPQEPTAEEVCRGARRIAVIDAVTDTTNIGAIFRSAAALGIDAVLLTEDSCDPYNRRSIRVSMGTVFVQPWAWIHHAVSDVRSLGFHTVALALRHDSVSLDDNRLKELPRLAFILGTEGDGLPQDVIDGADDVVRIPMARGVDSLNVAAASAVAFWELRQR